MIQKDKDLLLKDLCARLPYGVMVECSIESGESIDLVLDTSHIDEFVNNSLIVKPYLRPMSSMTKEEFIELENYLAAETISSHEWLFTVMKAQRHTTNFLYSRHFDILGLIEMGLALEAPEDMYK